MKGKVENGEYSAVLFAHLNLHNYFCFSIRLGTCKCPSIAKTLLESGIREMLKMSGSNLVQAKL